VIELASGEAECHSARHIPGDDGGDGLQALELGGYALRKDHEVRHGDGVDGKYSGEGEFEAERILPPLI
jgi:hypothetical protein